jgi:xylulokinase
MANIEKIIAYDLGTGGIKASLFDVSGVSYAHIFEQYATFYSGDDIHEQNPDDWWNGIIHSTRALIEKSSVNPEEIVGISISGHSLGAVPVDKSGALLRSLTPIWSDTRASKQSEEFFKTVSYDDWYLNTGNGFPSECYTIFKIIWYRDNEPDMFSKIYKILGSKDYCNLRLTGKMLTDYSYASGSGVYSLNKHNYVPEYIQASGINPNILPEIIPSHGIVGNLTKEASLQLGLPTSVKVICGGVDNSCMALGSMGTKDGRSYTSLGSSSWIAVIGNQPILDLEYKPFVFEHCIEGLYASATSIFSAGNSFRWVRDNICHELLDREASGEIKDSYAEMNVMLEKSPIGSNKLIFNPSMAGGAMIEESKNIVAGFVGLSLGHTRNDLVRAAMEGITFNLKYAIDILSKYHPGLTKMLLVGGGSKSKIWRQMFADIFNLEIIKTNIDQDAASLGAAALVAYGLGYWSDYERLDKIHVINSIEIPITENTIKYNKIYPIHREVAHYMALAGNRLHDLSL